MTHEHVNAPPSRSRLFSCSVLVLLLGFVLSCAAGAFIITPEAREHLILATYIVLGLAAVGGASFGLWYGVEKMLIIRAQRKQEQNRAEFNVYETTNGDLHIRELNKRVDWRAASRDPRVYANGHWVTPTAEEMAAFGQWAMTQSRGATAPRLIAQQTAALPAPSPIDLLDVLRRTRKVLVVGPEGAGKTSLLHAIIRQRLTQSTVVVIDPHGNVADWPAGCEVIGPGRRYDLIERRFRDIETELDRRYKLIAAHSGNRYQFKQVTLIIDEWTQLLEHVESGASFIKMMLTESRKAAFDVFVAGHSERVETLGLKGKGDLKRGFATVRLYFDQVSKSRRQTVDYGDDIGERDAFFVPSGGGTPTPEPGRVSEIPDWKPPESALPVDVETAENAEFARLVERGMSRRQASLQAYGKPYSGEKIIKRAKAALGEF